MEPKLGQNSI